MMPYNRVHGKSYIKVYKENKKQDKIKKIKESKEKII